MGILQSCSILCILLHLSGVSSQSCDITRNLLSVRLSPSGFRGTTAVSPAVSGCVSDAGTLLCNAGTVIDDGALTLEQPNFASNSDYLNQFVAWSDASTTPFLSFEVHSSANVSAIDLYLLNYPLENIGLPTIALYGTSQPTVVDPAQPGTATVTPVEFDLLNNDDLSSDDYMVRKVTLRPRTPLSSPGILIRWSFADLHRVEWFAVSEVRFCEDGQPALVPSPLLFQNPAGNVTLQPSAEMLNNESLTLTCTVSVQGSFTWQWRPASLQSNGGRFSILSADGTRTSILTISGLDFNDSGVYSCDATSTTFPLLAVESRSYNVQFPTTLNTPSSVTGFVGDGFVILTCEVHGYATFSSTPVWTSDNEANFTDTSKFAIDVNNSESNLLIYSNGSVGQGIVSILTINQLRMQDEGSYTCDTGNERNVTQLVVEGGTSPPPTTLSTNPTTATATTEAAGPTGEGTSSNTGIVAGVVITLAIVIIVITATIIATMVLLHMRRRKSSAASIIIRRRTPSVNDSTEMQQHLTKADIEWQVPATGNGFVNEVDGSAVYATVMKKNAPVVPPQNFIKTGLSEPPANPPQDPPSDTLTPLNTYVESHGGPKLCMSNGVSDPQLNIYEEARPPQRRMTNSSTPKLAKLKASGANVALDQNPIYESSGNINIPGDSDRQALVQPNESPVDVVYPQPDEGSVDVVYAQPDEALVDIVYAKPDEPQVDVVYAQPIRRNPSTIKNAVEKKPDDPVYSESLTPAMFKQHTADSSNVALLPYGPIYAEPTVNKKAHLKSVKLVKPDNFLEQGIIGIGQFGEVVLAETVNLSRSDLGLTPADNNRSVPIKVAIKKLKSDADNPVRDSFEKEIQFMSTLRDENIVMLLAVHKGAGPFIVMEYMENGDLHQFLEEYEQAVTGTTILQGQIPISILLHMSLQVGSGMRYLALHNCVHRDLATRNCLVGENYTVKIADFGMSRKLYGESYYKVRGRALLPIRWMAPESFYGKFSEKTDVWSFGVVMWEIFTLCQQQPYEEKEDQEVIQDAIREEGHLLLSRPEACPASVYDVMLQCWKREAERRACFKELYDSLTAIYHTM